MATEAVEEEESILPYGAITCTLEIDRDKLLNMLSDVLTSQHYKITKGRIRDAKSEKIKLDSVRVLAYLCSVYNGILKDRDLTDIERRVEALENAKQKP